LVLAGAVPTRSCVSHGWISNRYLLVDQDSVRRSGKAVETDARWVSIEPAWPLKSNASIENDLDIGKGAQDIQDVSPTGRGDRSARHHTAKSNPTRRHAGCFIEFMWSRSPGELDRRPDIAKSIPCTEDYVLFSDYETGATHESVELGVGTEHVDLASSKCPSHGPFAFGRSLPFDALTKKGPDVRNTHVLEPLVLERD
jgi:hypothetical protein